MKLKVYTDGSYDEGRRVYGGGVVILGMPGEDEYVSAQVCGNNPDFTQHRNVSGEILAVIKAMEIISNIKDVDEVTIYHDYTGIKFWATGEWRAKLKLSRLYVQCMQQYAKQFKINFVKVKGHSGDRYNTIADRLAYGATREGFKNNA